MWKRLILIQFSRVLVPLLVMLFHVAEKIHDYWSYSILHVTRLPLSGGVHYFFALSGCMLYYNYHRKFTSPHATKNYLLHRFIRIYPLYWVLTFVTIIIFLFFPSLGERTCRAVILSLPLIPDPQPVISFTNDYEPPFGSGISTSLPHCKKVLLVVVVNPAAVPVET